MIRVAAASVAGTVHERLGLPCQDACVFRLVDSETLILAVADGAGSASQAEEGAALAAQVAAETLAGCPLPPMADETRWRSLLGRAVMEARYALDRRAQETGIAVREFAATLILAAARREGVAAAQTGDGALIVRDAQGDLHTLIAPQMGEYYNETRFLTSVESVAEVETALLPKPVTHLAAFSDGFQHLALKLPEGTPHPPLFTPLFQFVAHIESLEEGATQLEAFLRSPRLRDRAEDDITLLLAALD
jgi:hypothetical protein